MTVPVDLFIILILFSSLIVLIVRLLTCFFSFFCFCRFSPCSCNINYLFFCLFCSILYCFPRCCWIILLYINFVILICLFHSLEFPCSYIYCFLGLCYCW